MLKDRRVLLEQEITKAQDEAATMYLDIVTQCGDVHSTQYQTLRNKIMDLQFDLDLVNLLISKGNE